MGNNSTSRIALNELRYLLFSPIGWIVLAIFFTQTALELVGLLDFSFSNLAFGNNSLGFANYFFTNAAGGVFRTVISDVYLIVPLITMATFSRELQSGSIKLLMSSPVSVTEIVLGKFIGVAIFLSILASLLSVLVMVVGAITPDFDYPATMPGILGIYLLTCAYAAIGIFVSSLTKYQVVAAIVTLTVLFVLQGVAAWLSGLPGLNEIAAWASLAGRANTFRDGVYSTPDLAYFLVIIALFIGFSVLRLASFRTGERTLSVAPKAVVLTAIAIGAGWIMSLPALSAFFDMTYDRRNSLSPESLALMERLEGPWEIVTYSNFLDRMGARTRPERQIQDRKRWSLYRQQNSSLNMEYVYFYDIDAASQVFARPQDGRSDSEIVQDYVDRSGLSFAELLSGPELDHRVDADLTSEGFSTFRVLKWNNRQVVLRSYRDQPLFPNEQNRAAALKTLLDGPVVIGVVDGQGERRVNGLGSRDYSQGFTQRDERFALINQGFSIRNIELDERVPTDVDIVLLADPQIPYSDFMRAQLVEFIERGGDMAILVDPSSGERLRFLLEELGLKVGQPVQQSMDQTLPPDFLLGATEPGVANALLGDVVFSVPVALDGAVSLFPAVQGKGFARSEIVTYGRYVFGYGLQKQVGDKTQRIVVFGDADLFSNANIDRREPSTNRTIILNAFHWLTDEEFPVQRTRRSVIDRQLSVGREAMSVIQWSLVGGVPLIILISGGAILMSRRRL